MDSVLLQDELLEAAVVENESIPVEIEVNPEKDQTVWFTPFKGTDYTIEKEGIKLIGSGGAPREFRLTFTLSAVSYDEGYRLLNPALKFFQGGSTKAGFRVSPDAERRSVYVVLFNTLAAGDHHVRDQFSVLVDPPVGKSFAHDPSIVWDPPNG